MRAKFAKILLVSDRYEVRQYSSAGVDMGRIGLYKTWSAAQDCTSCKGLPVV